MPKKRFTIKISLWGALFLACPAMASDGHAPTVGSGDAKAVASASPVVQAAPVEARHGAVSVSSLAAEPTAQAPRGAGAATHGAAHWGYEGQSGPLNWGNLGHPVCANGQKQSPIDIARLTEGPLQEIALRFSYKDSPIDAVNNGHTIQFNYWTGSGLTVLAQGEAPQNFALAQFHFHSLSEHTVSGRAYPMEMHLVHKSAQGDLAVVGVLLKSADPGEAVPDNPSWAAVFGALPGQSGMRLSSKTVLNAEALLPSERSVYHYTGSLTTPPCSEGVKWFVMTEPVTLPAAFIERFRTIYTHNFRPIQAQNARALLLGVPNTDSRQGQVVH